MMETYLEFWEDLERAASMIGEYEDDRPEVSLNWYICGRMVGAMKDNYPVYRKVSLIEREARR
jgi:hypothetical protein